MARTLEVRAIGAFKGGSRRQVGTEGRTAAALVLGVVQNGGAIVLHAPVTTMHNG